MSLSRNLDSATLQTIDGRGDSNSERQEASFDLTTVTPNGKQARSIALRRLAVSLLVAGKEKPYPSGRDWEMLQDRF